VAVIVGLVATVALVVWEKRCPDPLFDGAILRRRTFWVPTATIFVVQFALGGLMFLNTQFVQLVMGFSALAAGAFLMPALLVWTLSSATAGVTARLLGPRNVAALGVALAAVGLVLIALSGRPTNYWLFVGGLVLVGCMGVAPALMTHTAVENYPARRRGVGSAINSVAIRFGLAFGVAALGTVLALVFRRAIDTGLVDLGSAQADEADNSLGGALQVADDLGGSAGDALAASARMAFADGFRVTLLAAAVLLLIVALFIRLALPTRHSADRPTAHPTDDASGASA
jgi:DHA2 family multidrug resistance protein-like MFS transporter